MKIPVSLPTSLNASLVVMRSLRGRISTFKMIWVAAALYGGLAHAWDVIVVNGKMVNIDPRPPVTPNDKAECDEYRKSAQLILHDINKAHSECLETHRGYEANPGGNCTRPECQSLHTAMDALQKKISDGYSSCTREVLERNSSSTNESGVSERDELYGAGSKILSGPIAAAKKYVRESMSESIGWAFGIKSGYVKNGINAAGISSYLWNRTTEVRRKCPLPISSGKVAQECDEELMQTFQTLSNRVPTAYSNDPAIGLIQRAMMERLHQIQEGVISEIDNIDRGMEEITTDASSAPPRSNSRRGRSKGLIENQ